MASSEWMLPVSMQDPFPSQTSANVTLVPTHKAPQVLTCHTTWPWPQLWSGSAGQITLESAQHTIITRWKCMGLQAPSSIVKHHKLNHSNPYCNKQNTHHSITIAEVSLLLLLTLLGEKVAENTSFRVGMELEKVQKQGRDEKASRTLPHYGTMPAASLASNAMHLDP